MKKKLAIAAGAVIVLLAILAACAWYLMNQPLYEPGMARASRLLDPPPQDADRNYWRVEPNVRLYHYSEGTGSAVLFIHGGPGIPTRQVPAGLKLLAGSHRLIFYDQRGCGKSSRPVDRFTSPNFYNNMISLDAALGMKMQISDIERIRRILGEEKLLIVGHSFGGFLAALYAAEFPDRVKAMVLVAPASTLVMPIPADGGLMEELRQAVPQTERSNYDAFLKRYFDFGHLFTQSEASLTALNTEFGKFYKAAADARGMQMPGGEGMAEIGGWMVQAMYLSMGRHHDYRAALKKVTVPVLVLHGEKDLQTPEECRVYVQALPRARFETIANAGHFPFIDQPESFAAAVGVFLRELN